MVKFRKARTITTTSNINSALRKIWLYSPERRQVLKKNALPNSFYLCEKCKKIYKKTLIQVDHIIDYAQDDDWNKRIERLFDISNMQVLCKHCHSVKTKSTRKTSAKKRI